MKVRQILILSTVLLLSGCGKRVGTAEPPVTATSTAAPTVVTTAAGQEKTEVTTAAHEPPKDLALKGTETLEVYQKISVDEFITEKNVELKNGDSLVDTSEIGEKKITVSYEYEGSIFEKELSYTVKDPTEPVILNGGWSAVHLRGRPFDLSDHVGFADNYDRAPVLTYEGTVDINKTGNYPLKATVTDSSGNSTSWDLTITVADSETVSPDNNARQQFADFAAKYGGDGRRLGIDVSTWQGDVDFNAVKAAGAEFVMIRIGYYYDHIVKDDQFDSNIKKARDAGLDVGVYFYTTDNSEEKLREHARWIAEQLDGSELELPVAFDWEEFSNFQQYGMSIYDLNQLYLAFNDEMKKSGYETMLYSSKNFLNNFWSEDIKDATPVWLAHFVDETDYTGDYAIWQSSCYGKIPGIAGDVDLDILYTPL